MSRTETIKKGGFAVVARWTAGGPRKCLAPVTHLLFFWPGMQRRIFLFLWVGIAALSGCVSSEQRTPAHLDPNHWKEQTLTDILPYWTKHAVDTVNGGFYCSLDADWNPDGQTKFPSMIARHLFSYSAAYLMSGQNEHIEMADRIKDYLLTHAWDDKYGGWYDELTATGDPQLLTKSTFVQVYVITGLALYYAVTHDAEVLDYINRSNVLLEENVWDKETGGYFDGCQQDWTLQAETKSVSSQLAPLSGYLLYLYTVNRDEKYLRQAERILDHIMQYMTDPETGWILEVFDRNWTYIPGATGAGEINVGHNIEVAWSLLRVYMLNNRQDYLHTGLALADRLHQFGFDKQNGFWYATIGNQDPGLSADFTFWWIQAYGNMFDLILHHVKPDGGYADAFKSGAAFWDNYFLDESKGDTHMGVRPDGTPSHLHKAEQFKSSYHSVEHGMLNYLYLTNWVNAKPFTLYFRIDAAEGERLYPLLIEQSNARISRVVINGSAYGPDGIDSTFMHLPALKAATVEVSME